MTISRILFPSSKTSSKSNYMVKDPKEAAKCILKVLGAVDAGELLSVFQLGRIARSKELR